MIVIGNVQDSYFDIVQGCMELISEALLVFVFHDEHQVRPTQEFFCHSAAGRGASACGADFDPGIVPVDCLRGRAAPLIAAANKEDAQWSHAFAR